MKQLTFNSTQLLFVRVPITIEERNDSNLVWKLVADDIYLPLPKGNEYELLGTIQKSSGIVSTTIPDEVLEGLVEYADPEGGLNRIYNSYDDKIFCYHNALESFASRMESQGLTLREGEKKAVLKIK